MSHVTVNGTRLWYQLHGKGPVLVPIGGFALLHNQFDFCREMIVDAGYSVLDWNFRCSGNSDWTMVEPFTLEQWVEDLRAILDDAGLNQVMVWGTSTGSIIGQRFAAKYPERMRALVTYPWFRSDRTWQDIFTTAEWVARVYGIRQLSRLFAGVVLSPKTLYTEDHFKYEKWSGPVYEKNVNMTSMRSLMDVLSNVDLTGDIPRIQCPTMLLMGNDSALNDDEDMESASYDKLVRDFLALKPDAKVQAIPNAGSTYCMITNPKETVELLLPFLDKHKT